MKKINENELTMVAGGCPQPYVEPVPAPEQPELPLFDFNTVVVI